MPITGRSFPSHPFTGFVPPPAGPVQGSAALQGAGSLEAESSLIGISAPSVTGFAQTAFTRISAAFRDCTSSISWEAGDLVVVMQAGEGPSFTLTTPTATGLTFTSWAGPVGNCQTRAYSASPTSPGSATVRINLTSSASTYSFGGVVWVWHGTDGRGNSATAPFDSTSPFTASLSRAYDHSAVAEMLADYAANNTGTWGWTPAVTHDRLGQTWISGAATYYAGDWGDQGTAGGTDYGITESGYSITPSIDIAAVEIRGTVAGALQATVALTGVGALTAQGTQGGSVALAGGGRLTAAVTTQANVGLAGAGNLTASPLAGASGSVALAGGGRLIAFGSIPGFPQLAHTTQANALSVTIPATTAGNCLVVCVCSFNTFAQSISGMTLGGSADNFAALITSGSVDEFISIWADPNCAGGQTSVVVSGTNLKVDANNGNVAVFEFANVSKTSPLDQHSAWGSAFGGTWTSLATPTTTQAAEAWVGAAEGFSALTGPDLPWTNAAATFGLAGYWIVYNTGQAEYTGVNTNSATSWAAVVVTLLPSLNQATVSLGGAGSLTATPSGAGGAATLTGAGGLQARAVQQTTCVLAGAGSLAAQVTRSATVALTGTGSLSSQVTKGAAVALAGTGSLTVGVTEIAPASLAGVAGVAVKVTTPAAVSLAGTGSLTVAVTEQTTAKVAGAGSLTGPVTQQTFSALAGVGALTALPQGQTSGTAALQGTGSLTAAVTEQAFTVAAGTGGLTAAAAQQTRATVAGAGTLNAQVTQPATVTLTGSGSVATQITWAAACALSGAGSLAAKVTESATCGLAGVGSLLPQPSGVATANLAGSGSLATAYTQQVRVSLAGASNLTTLVTEGTSSPLAGIGGLKTQITQQSAVSLTASGSLNAAVSITPAVITLAGTGSLNAQPTQQTNAALPGTGVLNAGVGVQAPVTLGAGSALTTQVTQGSSAAPTGAGGLTAGGLVPGAGAYAGAAVGGLLTNATQVLQSAATLPGTGALGAFVTATTTLGLTGAGALQAVSQAFVPAAAALAAAGSLKAGVAEQAPAALTGTSSLTSAVVTRVITAFPGAGDLLVAASQGARSGFQATGSLTAGGVHAGGAALQGAGSLLAQPQIRSSVAAALQATGGLLPQPVLCVTCDLPAVATLTVQAFTTGILPTYRFTAGPLRTDWHTAVLETCWQLRSLRTRWRLAVLEIAGGGPNMTVPGGGIAVSRLSTQYVQVPVNAQVAGQLYNPTGDLVQFAFLVNAQAVPQTGDWVQGSWDTQLNALYPYLAKCLIGPTGGTALTVGTYNVWVKITDNPEIPVLQTGLLTIT